MKGWPLALGIVLLLALLAPLLALAAPLGPLDTPHIPQFGPGADAYWLDCSCAVGVTLLATYTDQLVTVDQCCREVGGCPVHLITINDWLTSHGVPMTWWYTTPQLERDMIRAGHPFITVIHVGSAYHAIVVVGFDDEQGLVWVHDPLGATGPSTWTQVNYSAMQWKDPRNGQPFVTFTMSELPGWNRELGRVVTGGLDGRWVLESKWRVE